MSLIVYNNAYKQEGYITEILKRLYVSQYEQLRKS